VPDEIDEQREGVTDMSTTTTGTTVRERPIPFSGPMVRAILDGRKTQFRIPCKGLGVFVDTETTMAPPTLESDGSWVWPDGTTLRCPFGAPGDVIWVRETFQYNGCETDADGSESWHITYRADPQAEEHSGMGWRSPATMPRWASRITLEVTDVRVERLQDITEADAVAEGLLAREGDGAGPGPGYKWRGTGYHGAGFTKSGEPTFHTPGVNGRCSCAVGGPTPAQCAYREYWDARHGRGSWAANPWVWALTFRRINHA
jgi:hypothetical protein